MKNHLKIISVLVVAFAVHSAAFAESNRKEDAAKVNTACAKDAQTAGCAGEVVGKGLLKCLKNYKRTDKSFKVSSDCKAAIGQLREDKQGRGQKGGQN